jgi:excisionase family DNA binding protein
MAIQASRTQRKLFRIPQAVDYLGGAVKAATLRQWIWLRKIETVRIGRAVCIPQDALDRLIDRGTIPALEQQ